MIQLTLDATLGVAADVSPLKYSLSAPKTHGVQARKNDPTDVGYEIWVAADVNPL